MVLLFADIDWESFLLGEEKWGFLLETGLRTLIMFVVILFSLRMLGKRGVKQLSVFELGVIIGLGSAAGDPMFYKDVGLLMGVLVFVVVIGLYRLITFLINRSNRFEAFLEGTPTVIVEEGCFLKGDFEQEPLAQDEFFAQLRLNCVSHLGQVKLAILETNGEVSLFFYPDKEVKYGLPVIPKLCDAKLGAIHEEGYYACSSCGNTEYLQPAPETVCKVCREKQWVKAINEPRID